MNNLFNDKILSQKANAEVDLSKNNLQERRKYLNKWIDMLEKGILDKTKEEQLQGEYISDIFSKVLNASNITDGKEEWNLERETKTLLDGQKADGTLGFFDNKGKKDIRALIELKGANINLDTRQKRVGDTRSAVEQAFGYAPKYGKNCHWIIVSNFKEIRLYRANSMLEYQVFFLEDLKDDLEFKKFIYVLSFYALVGTENKKAKSLELSEEYQKVQNEIEKKFYNEYKNIRNDIFENMKKNNPEVSEMIIIEKVQKLLDRFLFICFCEDKGLIPENSYSRLVKRGEILDDIFESFKSFCNWINSGNKSKNIPHFNGGLFKTDSVLDNLLVDDEVFKKLEKISDYDFESDLNERILGHIFEQSISDIEELKNSSNDKKIDKKESKRKKDGIFYTPKYITKYIVETTMNAWIEDKKKELGEENLPELQEKDFKYDIYKKNYSKNFRKHVEFWENFRSELRKIKIIDPACGSGAFLIEAFDFLLKYNQMIDEKIFNMTGTKNLFDDTTKEILQNNIFGVDLNKESVEITKLSLWLRTADKNKTLATLENNIKCGNSLISDKNISEKAFDWKNEFSEVFEEGGFDIVIGNPPYVQLQKKKEESKILSEQNYKTYESTGDLYCLFYEKGINLLKNNGILGFITSNKWLRASYGKSLRKYFLENTNPQIIIDLGTGIFESATVDSNIFITKKEKNENELKALDLTKIDKFTEFSSYYNGIINVQFSGEEIWTIENPIEKSIRNKIEKNGIPLEKCNIKINRGILTGFNDAFVITKEIKDKLIEEDSKSAEIIKPILRGRDIGKYNFNFADLYLINTHNGYKDIPRIDVNDYPAIKNHLDKYYDKLEKRYDKGKTPYNLRNCDYIDEFEKESIIWKRIGSILRFSYGEKCYSLDSTCILTGEHIKYLLCLFNSKVGHYLLKDAPKTGTGDLLISVQAFDNLIIQIPINEKEFIEKADAMIELNKELQNKIQKFKNRLSSNLDLKEFSKKIENFYELSFKEFLKELGKQKIKLSLSDQDEWEEYFENYKKAILEIKEKINKTDKEIDLMIYKLYDLTAEEIKTVEENL